MTSLQYDGVNDNVYLGGNSYLDDKGQYNLFFASVNAATVGINYEFQYMLFSGATTLTLNTTHLSNNIYTSCMNLYDETAYAPNYLGTFTQ